MLMVQQVFEVIERIANLAAGEFKAPEGEGLRAVHFAILGYLQRCNVFSDTPSAVAAYLGHTKGTVSQSIRVLERRGYIKKSQDADDRRIQHLAVTAKGLRLSERSGWPPLLRDAERVLGSGGLARTQAANERLLAAILQARGYKTFGVCRTCRYFKKAAHATYNCSLLGVALEPEQIERICHEHQYPPAAK